MNEIIQTKLVPVVVFKTIEDVDVILPALSKGGVNVAEICAQFGGGGHALASGCVNSGACSATS